MNHAENDAGERSPRTERSCNPLPISDLQTPPKGWRITHEFDETPRDDGATGPCYLVSARKPSFRAEICANSWHPGRDFGTNPGDGGA